MEAKEQALRSELTDLQAKLQDPSVYSDPSYPKLAKRQAYLDLVISLFDERKKLQQAYKEASEILNSDDVDLSALAQEELGSAETALVINETSEFLGPGPYICKFMSNTIAIESNKICALDLPSSQLSFDFL